MNEDYLSHHGILGQKWGIRRYQNKDGSLTAEGKKRYQQEVHRIISNAKSKEDISRKVFDAVGADKKHLAYARDILDKNAREQKKVVKESEELFKDLKAHGNIHTYEAASELASWAYMSNNNDVDNLTLDDLAYRGFHGVLDDGQQSQINAYSMYTSQNGLTSKVVELGRKSFDSEKNARDRATAVVVDAFKDVGLDDVTAYETNPKYSAANAIIDRLASVKYNDTHYSSGAWAISSAAHAVNFTDAEKTNMTKSLNYVKRIKDSSDENTWWYVTAAAENLGLSSTKLKSLTSNDWKRINREIEELKDEGW